MYETETIPTGTLAERVRHIVQCAFDGRRILIFAGGAAEPDDVLLEQIHAIREGGGFGSIIGRNSFQRKKPEALELSRAIALLQGRLPASHRSAKHPPDPAPRQHDASSFLEPQASLAVSAPWHHQPPLQGWGQPRAPAGGRAPGVVDDQPAASLYRAHLRVR